MSQIEEVEENGDWIIKFINYNLRGIKSMIHTRLIVLERSKSRSLCMCGSKTGCFRENIQRLAVDTAQTDDTKVIVQ